MKRIARLATLVAAAVMVAAFGAPAQAAANPYTPQAACGNDFGGSWGVVSDGRRSLLTEGGAKWGDVYLLFNAANGRNCVATIKTAYLGRLTWTRADLWPQSRGSALVDMGYFKYYAAVQTEGDTRGECVKYSGTMLSPDETTAAYGGRNTWGNCG
jgi:hypothetical protein